LKFLLTSYLYTFSLYENPSFIIFSAETEYIATRSWYQNINFLRVRIRRIRKSENCYWPLHNKSIVRCRHHMQEKLVYCWTCLENLWFKIEVTPFIINFSTDLTTVVKFEVQVQKWCGRSGICGLFNIQLWRIYQRKKFCKSRIIDR
jgi:hypothetical protein